MSVARMPGDRWTCSCGEPLIGALTVAGKVAPVTLKAKDGGNVWLGRRSNGTVACATIGGLLLEEARRAGLALHLNHFADCPDRARYARSGSGEG